MQDENNFYAYFINANKGHIKKVFEKEGWISKKASWTDFELSNNWSELILEGEENTPLLNGSIDFCQENLKVLDNLFAKIGSQFQYEFYDQNKNLILQKNNGS